MADMRLITLFSCLGIVFIEEFLQYLCWWWWCCTNVPIPISRVSQHVVDKMLRVVYSTWVPFVLIPIPLDSIDKVLVLASYSLIPPSPYWATMCFSKKKRKKEKINKYKYIVNYNLLISLGPHPQALHLHKTKKNQQQQQEECFFLKKYSKRVFFYVFVTHICAAHARC